ncbi:hypothetical protein CH063_14864, partial [Colletotrichum higginsianum]
LGVVEGEEIAEELVGVALVGAVAVLVCTGTDLGEGAFHAGIGEDGGGREGGGKEGHAHGC